MRNCGVVEVKNVEQLKVDAVAFLGDMGWVIEGDDDLRRLDFTDLLSEQDCNKTKSIA